MIKPYANKEELSSLADLMLIVDSITGYGGGRNRSDSSCGVDGFYYVQSTHMDMASEEEDATVEVDLFFTVDWENKLFILRDASFSLIDSPPGWTNVQEWIIDTEHQELRLVRMTDTHECFLAEEDD